MFSPKYASSIYVRSMHAHTCMRVCVKLGCSYCLSLIHLFIHSFYIYLEISYVQGRYDTWKCTDNYNSHQLKSLCLMELIH